MTVSGRRLSLWLGLMLCAAGLTLVGYVGWQVLGSNWVSQQTHEDVLRSLERSWADGSDDVDVEHGRATAVIRVPRFGDEYAVPVLEGTSEEALESGVGHFAGSAPAGGVGNYALAAHRITHGEPFRDFPRLRAGDEVIIETRDTTFTYVLDTDGDALVIPFTETWVLADSPTNPEGDGAQPLQAPRARLLTLTTCAELFHTDDRMVAFGHLVDATPQQSRPGPDAAAG